MKLIKGAVKKVEKIKEDVYLLSFSSPYLAKKSAPGQFLHIKIDPATLLRRPFSVHKIRGNDIFILFRIRGKGTNLLSQYKKGNYLDILGPLGNGFNYSKSIKRNCQHVIVAGGMGVAPLIFLGEKL